MQHRDSSSRGFTLIELLVVISILAALIGLLVPSLFKTGVSSRSAKCAKTLNQVFSTFQVYASKNFGNSFNFYPDKTYVDYTTPDVRQSMIPNCPEVQIPGEDRIAIENEEDQIIGDIEEVIKPGASKLPWKKQRTAGSKVYYGSYGMNGFMYNRGGPYQGGNRFALGGSNPLSKAYPEPWYPGLTVEDPSMTPVFADANMPYGWPSHDDKPPRSLARGLTENRYGSHLGRFLLNRHEEQTNIVYADGSARSARLKELWVRRWNKNFNIDLEDSPASGLGGGTGP